MRESQLKITEIEEKLPSFLNELQNERRLLPSSLNNYNQEIGLFFRILKQGGKPGLKEYLSKLAPATHLRKLIIWRSFLQFCGSDYSEFLKDFKQPKIRQKEPRFLNENEIFKLEAACFRSKHRLRDRLMISLGLELGLRIQETLNLRCQDFESDWLKITRKGGKVQRLPLTASLQAQFHFFKQEKIPNPGPEEFVFAGLNGQALTVRAAQKIIRKLADSAGLKEVHPHALRHSFATRMAANGISLAVLKEFLGHQRLQTTERYLHITPQHLKEGLQYLKPKRI